MFPTIDPVIVLVLYVCSIAALKMVKRFWWMRCQYVCRKDSWVIGHMEYIRWQRGKRVYVSPDGKGLRPPTDTRNIGGVISALPALGGWGGLWGRDWGMGLWYPRLLVETQRKRLFDNSGLPPISIIIWLYLIFF